MQSDFVNLTAENLAEETLCCIVRTKKPHPGVEEKRAWLAERLKEGHVFRKLRGKECAFIEYAPLETAWVPAEGAGVFVYLLLMGMRRAQGAWLRTRVDGVLPAGREGPEQGGRLHAGRAQAEGLAG